MVFIPDRGKFCGNDSVKKSQFVGRLFCGTPPNKVHEQSNKRVIKERISCDGNAQEPAKGPCQGFVRFRHDEFGKFQAGRKKSEQRRWNLRLDGHGNRQCQKTGEETEASEEKVAR